VTKKTLTAARAIPSPRSEARGEGKGEGLSNKRSRQSSVVARLLRRNQTKEEKELRHALKAGRFAGFKFRRQHSLERYYLDFFCPTAKLSGELDGFHHGLPEVQKRDAERKEFLESKGVEELRFWNHHWNKNREGVLLEIWGALHRRTGCVAVMRKIQNHRFVPPNPDQIIPPGKGSLQ
jgi:very-short-patch-repair endonuclease